jgi:hypothetical protein
LERQGTDMKLMDYRTLRAGVQLNASPAGTADLRPIAADLARELRATGLFSSVEVDYTDNRDHLLVAMASFGAHLTEEEVAIRLEDVWHGRMSFDYWAVHSTLVTKGQVELQGATLAHLGGPYITVHVVAQKVAVPVQRVAVD